MDSLAESAHRSGWRLAVAAAIAFTITGGLPLGAQEAGRCDGEPYHLLDFWEGRWDVRLAGGSEVQAGTNTIEKTLGGCAVLEHWSDSRGGAGKSLFYYHPAEKVWKQVWVAGTGHVKEKRVVTSPGAGAVRFEGEIRLADGTRVLDRTTLTPRPDGTVRQHIEQSADGGATWQTTFDAIYTRKPGPSPRVPDPLGRR